MKNIIKISYLFALALLIGACSEDDEKLIVAPESSSTILTPSDGQHFILNQFEEQTNTAITFSWDDSSYETPTNINYAIEMALSGTDFSDVAIPATIDQTYFTMNIADFNATLAGLGVTPFTETSIDIRIKSSIGDPSQLVQYSETVTILVTTFTTDLPKIAVPGNHQGWDPPTAPLLASSGFAASDYEGYVWLDGEHKFLAPNESLAFEWGNTDWGDDGTFTGHLVEEDEVNCLAAAGYYYVKVDTVLLTYSETNYSSWGIIGDATPGGWDGDTDLTYDPATQTWRLDISLTSGEIKFRANDAWDWNYGDTGADGFLDLNSPDNIAVPAAGNYTVVLDLSVPREYTYLLIQN
ncbi:SusE domain-containing protein [Bizionia arctica]|nr:SusE domain-containing protein [Bizionia arctica]